SILRTGRSAFEKLNRAIGMSRLRQREAQAVQSRPIVWHSLERLLVSGDGRIECIFFGERLAQLEIEASRCRRKLANGRLQSSNSPTQIRFCRNLGNPKVEFTLAVCWPLERIVRNYLTLIHVLTRSVTFCKR